jgi:thymidylate synthase ThyX
MTLPSYFNFSISNPDETDLVLVSLHDSRTNYTVRTALPNSGKQTASIMAFAGARYSRASITAEELFKEIKEAKKSANEKLATIFKNYGHASVADMAQLFAYIENLPQIYACKFYNESSIGGGQERSTRYQDFSGAVIDPLAQNLETSQIKQIQDSEVYKSISQKYEDLQKLALGNYRKHVEILTKKFTEVYQVDQNDKKQAGALAARVFDSARYFLPSGACNRTSICWITSAREWARIISQLKSYKDRNLNCLGEQLETLFAPDAEVAESIGYCPEAPDLIRYTSADETTSTTLSELQKKLDEIQFASIAKYNDKFSFQSVDVDLISKNFSPGLKVVAQNILSLYPNVNEKWLLNWLESLSDKDKSILEK